MTEPSSLTTQQDNGVTRQLCSWVDRLRLDDVPEDQLVRAKYLIPDSIGCTIVGAHLPWSEKAAHAILDMEPPGDCPVWGYSKRMQHGFAARNGLFGALLAKSGYTGIERVFEEPYGGFLAVFGEGSGKEPPFLAEELVNALGQTWQWNAIRVKPHASMAGTHCTIDCVAALQREYPGQLKDLDAISSIAIEMSEPAWKHGGWKARRPLTATGAQMSCAYGAAVQLVDGQVLPQQFQPEKVDRDVIWRLVDETECFHTPELGDKYEQRVIVAFHDGSRISPMLEAPKGVSPPSSNEILDKFRMFTSGLIEKERGDAIEQLVLRMEFLEDVSALEVLLSGSMLSPIA